MKKLRFQFLTFFAAVLLAVGSAANATSPFFRDLKIGDSGLDVLALQKVLNSDGVTQIAGAGPGSPGNETNYFGAKTAAAVVKFQEKYASEILTPAGLSRGTGFAGSFTRMRLSKLSVATEVLKSFETNNFAVASSTFGATPSPAVAPVYPSNYEGLDDYITGVKAAAIKKGYTADRLVALESSIRAEAATTTNFRELFFKNLKIAEAKHQEKLAEEANGGNIFSRLLARFEQAASSLVPQASAQMGAPFGGFLEFAMPCTCEFGEIWSVEVTPLPPTFAAILDYAMGEQMFPYYTAPFTLNFLGEYVPGAETCFEYAPPAECFLIPSWGLMTPMLGTSL